eukprot:TRINITY_DN1347_c0_g3_i1.p1 TRINITY_DN1347_c0_g3~~TRINITY_DN1347_c0_g3_i1.p1  ORF type:complete len:412 (+),score=71.70 TRINITY_DN1347_c0_g3_i1:380-1615(+)
MLSFLNLIVWFSLLFIPITAEVQELGKRKREESVYVSKLVLASESEYFRNLFSNGMAESSQTTIEVVVEADERPYFVDMIRSVFTEELQTASSVSDIIKVLNQCDKYLMESVANACKEVLKQQLQSFEDAEEYFSIILDYSHLADDEIAEIARNRLVDHFCSLEVDVIQRHYNEKVVDKTIVENFFSLSMLALHELLESSALQISSENAIFQAIMLWRQNQSKEVPTEDMINLFSRVRYEWLTTDYVVDVVLKNPYIRSSASIQNIIATVQLEKYGSKQRKRLSLPPRIGGVTSITKRFKIEKQNDSLTIVDSEGHLPFRGYVFCVVVARSKVLVLHVRLRMSGLVVDESFCVPFNFRFSYLDPKSNRWNQFNYLSSKEVIVGNTGLELLSVDNECWNDVQGPLTVELTLR